MPVKPGKPIRWSEMANSDELFLEMATPTDEDVLITQTEIVSALSLFLNAPLVEQEEIIGPSQQ